MIGLSKVQALTASEFWSYNLNEAVRTGIKSWASVESEDK